MDWKDYVIIGGALFLLFGGGVYGHYRTRAKGQIEAEPTGGGTVIDDVRRLATAVSTVGGKAFAEGGKLIKRGGLAYTARREHKSLHLTGAV
jgi:hypothetical protein